MRLIWKPTKQKYYKVSIVNNNYESTFSTNKDLQTNHHIYYPPRPPHWYPPHYWYYHQHQLHPWPWPHPHLPPRPYRNVEEKTININHYYNLDLSHIIVGQKPLINPNQIFVTIDCSNCMPYSADLSNILIDYSIKSGGESDDYIPLRAGKRVVFPFVEDESKKTITIDVCCNMIGLSPDDFDLDDFSGGDEYKIVDNSKPAFNTRILKRRPNPYIEE